MHSNYRKDNKVKNRVAVIFILAIFFIGITVNISSTHAQFVPVYSNQAQKDALQAQVDAEKLKSTGLASALEALRQEFSFDVKKSALAAAFKSALGNFLNKMAADTGAYLGSGGKGEKPLFITDGWGAYLEQAGDAALGQFVQEAGAGLNAKFQTLNNAYQNEAGRAAAVRSALGDNDVANEEYLNQVEEGITLECDIQPGTAQEYDACTRQVQADEAIKVISKYNADFDNAINDCYLEADIAEDLGDTESRCSKELVDDLFTVGSAASGGFTSKSAGALSGVAGVLNAFTADLCAPSSLNVSLAISLKIQGLTLQEGICSFSQIRDRLSKAVENSSFNIEFKNYFNQGENDIGVALTLQGRAFEASFQAEKEKALSRLENKGILPSTKGPSNFIAVPGEFVSAQIKKGLFSETNSVLNTYTGTIADALGAFVSSLAGGVLSQLKIFGLAEPTGVAREKFKTGGIFEALRSAVSSPSSSGKAGAELRFSGLKKIDFSGGGAFEVINALAVCPDAGAPGPTDCVVTENFRDAVLEGITVREALESGNLDGDLPLGFSSEGLEPDYNQGYPYRSLVILRKYRIIPVGWELAALYIRNFSGDTTTLGAVVADFDNASSPFYKLIDPNWVLKSPENFCALKGPGPEIINQQFLDGNDADDDGRFDGPNDNRPSITISRDNSYCADERSCLETNRDGSCKFYGYCTQDKPIWDFQGRSCEPVYNTCETFQDPDGVTAAYLKNTLDTEGCSANNAGCQWYCTDRNPFTSQWLCTQLQGERIQFDRDATSCPRGAVGCRRYFSTEPGLGTNLIPNSSFERYDGAPDDTTPDGLLLPSGVVVSGSNQQISSDAFIGRASLMMDVTLPTDYIIETGKALRGRTFLFSVFSKGCTDLNIQIDPFTASSLPVNISQSSTDPWERSSVFYTYNANPASNPSSVVVRMQPQSLTAGENCVVDAMMLEEGNILSGYAEYENGSETFIKTPPEGLNCTTANPDRSVLCDDYTLTCSPVEVGCSLYDPVLPGSSVPAIAQAGDFCPNECVGYDIFKQESTFFDLASFPTYFIPDSAGSCTAQTNGCDEFTNLDTVALGGEGKEYFKYVRQCVKPTPAAQCESFFSWIGTQTTGFQLVSESLVGGLGGRPAVTLPTPLLVLGSCNNADDALNNPECREYFDSGGVPHYVFHRITTLCTDQCVPLRKTDSDITSCADTGGKWIIGTCTRGVDAGSSCGINADCSSSVCTADIVEDYCLYNAVLSQGEQCSPAAAGCRAYTGNAGSNIREVYTDDFEDSDTVGWTFVGNISTESVNPGGHSIQSIDVFPGSEIFHIQTDETLFVDGILVDGKTYELSFWAKAAIEPLDIFINTCGQFGGFTAPCSIFPGLTGFDFGGGPATNSVRISTQWNRHTFGPFIYDEADALSISAITNLGIDFHALRAFGATPFGWEGSEFFLDNIVITEVKDSIYKIKNSWTTPNSCNNLTNDPFGRSCASSTLTPPPAGQCNGTQEFPCICSGPDVPPGPGVSLIPFQLGCAAYLNDGQRVTLSSFTNLCSEEAVMCEALIDTQNSQDYLSKIDFAICRGPIDSVSGDCTIRRTSLGNPTESVCSPKAGESTCTFTLIDPLSANVLDFTTDNDSVTTGEDEIVYIVNDPLKSCLSGDLGCRALGNPNSSSQFNPTIRITQGGQVFYATPFIGQQPAEILYQNLPEPKVEFINGTSVTTPGGANIFVYKHETATSTKFNMMFRLDPERGGYNGVFIADFPTVPLNSTVLVSDDPTELFTTNGRWGWVSASSDGGVIEIPTEGPWRFDIDITTVQNQCATPGVEEQRSRDICDVNLDCSDITAGDICRGPRGNVGFVSASGERILLDDVPSSDPEDNIIIEYNPTGFTVEGFTYSTEYIFDRPDEYEQTLCTDDTLWCQEFATGEGTIYFKDPRENVCEWRQSSTGNQGYHWYKKVANNSGIDILCAVADDKTLGEGVPIDTPIGECRDGASCRQDTDCQFGSCTFYAGSCPVAVSSCSEYLDPVTIYGNDILFNGDFEQNVDGNGVPDGWTTTTANPIISYTNGEVKVIHNPRVNFSQIPIVFEPNTLYTLRARIKGGAGETKVAGIIISNCSTLLGGAINIDPGAITSPDNSMFLLQSPIPRPPSGGCYDAIGNPSESISLYIDNSALNSGEYREFSGRFQTGGFTSYRLSIGAIGVTGDLATVGHWFEEISIVKTGVYYNLAETVDKTSCNGVIDLGEGCVPFNERVLGNEGVITSDLLFDADQSIEDGLISSDCENGGRPNGLCDSNVVINVRPDRQCAEWLTCSSTLIESGRSGIQDRCLDFSLCQSIDPDTGECNRTVPRSNVIENVTLNKTGSAKKYPLSLASHLTGYSKAGAEYRENNIIKGIVEGLVPFDQMLQIGQPVFVENGNFEIHSREGQPSAWVSSSGLAWNDLQFKVISDPVSAQNELADDRLSPEGRAFLRIGARSQALSNLLSVSAQSSYIVSGWINTSNLDSSDGGIRIEEYDIGGNAVLSPGALSFSLTARQQDLPFLDAGNKWTYKIAKFTTSQDTVQIRIQIGGSQNESSLGKIYYDNIEIKPALQIQTALIFGNECQGGVATPSFAGNTDFCALDRDCASGVCTANACIGGTARGSVLGDGDACSFDGDCASGICIDTSEIPENYYCNSTINDGNCYVTRECRLFPEKGSLSCEYFDNNGLTIRGLPGYCLEHDPNNRAICLQWWPVERIIGDAVDDIGKTYTGRTPLYMCIHARFGTSNFTLRGKTLNNNARARLHDPALIATFGTFNFPIPQLVSIASDVISPPDNILVSGIVSVSGTWDTGWADNDWVRSAYNNLEHIQTGNFNGICTLYNDGFRAGHNGTRPITLRTPFEDCQIPGANNCGCNFDSDCNPISGVVDEVCVGLWAKDEWRSSGGGEGGHIRDLRFLYHFNSGNWQYEYLHQDASGHRSFGGDFSQFIVEYTDPTAVAIGTLIPAPDSSYILNPEVQELSADTYWIKIADGDICNSGETCRAATGPTTNPHVVDLRSDIPTDLGIILQSGIDVVGIEAYFDNFWLPNRFDFSGLPVPLTRINPPANAAGWCILKGDELRSGFCSGPVDGDGQGGFCNGFQATHDPRLFTTANFQACDSDDECTGTDESCSDIWYYYDNPGRVENVVEVLVVSNVDLNEKDAWIEWWAGYYGCDCGPGLAAGLPDAVRLDINHSPVGQECSDVALVVSPSGEQTAWTGRVSEGSNYFVPDINISYGSDFRPFGGVVAPEPIEFPTEWDAVPNTCVVPAIPNFTNGAPCLNSLDCTESPYTQCGFIGKDPVTVQTRDLSLQSPYQVRAGTPYSCSDGANCPIGVCKDSNNICLGDDDCPSAICCTTSSADPACQVHPNLPDYQNSVTLDDGIAQIQRLFARSYGVWHWNGSEYIEAPTKNWQPPSTACSNNVRPLYNATAGTADLCGITPRINNITATSLQAQDSNFIDNTGFINLSFTTDVDFNQLPITRIKIDWGDNSQSIISSGNIRSRSSVTDPHQFFHLYSYWDLKGIEAGTDAITCFASSDITGSYCEVIIRIQVRDNWGWCNAYDPTDPSILGLYVSECDTETALKFTGSGGPGAVSWTNPGTGTNPISIIQVRE